MNPGHYTLPSCQGLASEADDDSETSPRPHLSPRSYRSTSYSPREGAGRLGSGRRGGDGDGDGGHGEGHSRAWLPSSSDRSVHASSPSWLPSRLTSPHRVLSATSLRDDYYTSSLSWGHTYVALTLRNELLLFHSHYPRERFAVFRFGRPSYTSSLSPAAGDGRGGAGAPQAVTQGSALHNMAKRPTSVVVSRQSDSTCFVGFDDGTVDLFLARGDSQHLQYSQSFDMPTPPTAGLLHGLASARQALTPSTGATQRDSRTSAETACLAQTARAVQQLAPSLASVGTMDTTAAHPWLAAAGTSASGVLTLDARLSRPCQTFRRADQPTLASSLSSSMTTLSSRAAATAAVQRVGSFLEQQARVCAVRWNASGSLLAVSDDHGMVHIWSLTQPRAPLHTIVLPHGGAIRALAFHPTNPSELLVGSGVAGADGLRMYDLSSAAPRWTWSGHTAAPTTQALYSPDGAFLVTAGGEVAGSAEWDPPLSRLPSGPEHPADADSTVHLGSRDAYGLHDRMTASSAAHMTTLPPGYGLTSTLESAAAAAAAVSSSSPRSVGESGGLCPPAVSPASASLLPLSVAAAAGPASAASPPTPEWAVSHALTLWKRGAPRGGHDVLREAVFDRTTHSPARWEDLLRLPSPLAGSGREGSVRDGTALSPVDSLGYGSPFDWHVHAEGSHAPRTASHHEGRGTGGVCRLKPQYALRGHTSRPLHLAAPYSPSPDTGYVASAAAGEDGTLRFWCAFKHADASGSATGASRSGVVSTYESAGASTNQDLYMDVALR